MDTDLKKQQQDNDRGWQVMLDRGRQQLGNHQTNLDFLKRSGLLKDDMKVLEIGCGIGTITHELTKAGFDIIGTDISKTAIEHGRKKYPGVRLEVHPGEILPFENNSFDMVISFDVLEHIKEVDRHLVEVVRVLRPGGFYLLQTPNKYCNAVYETLKTRSTKWKAYHPSLHSSRQLRRRFCRNGFDIEFVKMNTINEFSLNKFKRMHLPIWLMSRLDTSRLPLFLQTNFYVISQLK